MDDVVSTEVFIDLVRIKVSILALSAFVAGLVTVSEWCDRVVDVAAAEVTEVIASAGGALIIP